MSYHDMHEELARLQCLRNDFLEKAENATDRGQSVAIVGQLHASIAMNYQRRVEALQAQIDRFNA